ncbi:MAG: hypothetical protein ABI785_14040, partial [Gemmatimonadales bacterium]
MTTGGHGDMGRYRFDLRYRIGHGNCPKCGKPITAQTREQIIARIMAIETGTQYAVLAPVIRGQKGEYKDLFEDLRKQGFVR